MKLTNEMLLKYCAPRLIEEFGKETYLNKFNLPLTSKGRCPKTRGEPVIWSTLTFGKAAFEYTVQGAGKTPASALKAAGMGGIIDDAKKYYKEIEQRESEGVLL